MKLTAPLLPLALAVALVAGCGGEGTPHAMHNRALSALAAGEIEIAIEQADAAAEAGGARFAALRDFVHGNAEFARAEQAAEQARAVQAEPFAFELAIRRAQKARALWTSAAASAAEFPGARRNVERAVLRIEAYKKERDEAAAKRDPKRASGGPPKFNLVQQPTSKKADAEGDGEGDDPGADSGGEGDDAAAGGALAELSPDQVRGVLETLQAKEAERRAARSDVRRAASAGVEKDW